MDGFARLAQVEIHQRRMFICSVNTVAIVSSSSSSSSDEPRRRRPCHWNFYLAIDGAPEKNHQFVVQTQFDYPSFSSFFPSPFSRWCTTQQTRRISKRASFPTIVVHCVRHICSSKEKEKSLVTVAQGQKKETLRCTAPSPRF